MPIVSFKGDSPIVAEDAFIAPTAWIIGKAQIAREASIFFGAVLRGDINKISVGERSNIQENAVLHTSHMAGDCVVGDGVTVGHCAMLHSCRILGNSIIGMSSTILDGACIEENCMIGAHTLVKANMVVPSGSLVVGVPGKVVRILTEDELKYIRWSAEHYVEVASEYRRILSGGAHV